MSSHDKSILDLLIDPLKINEPASPQTTKFVKNIPWLYRYPQQQLSEWQMKIKSVVGYYASQSIRAEKELAQVEILPATEKRLITLADCYQKSAQEFAELAKMLTFSNAPQNEKGRAGGAEAPGAREGGTLDASQEIFFEKTPRQQTVMAYQDTLFRDWVWGQAEIEKQAEPLLPLLKGSKNWAVLGAGACGLPLYLHKNLKPESTLAIDINPVLFLPVQKLLSGQSFRCIEYPRIPRQSDFVAIEQELKPMSAEGFHLVFADAQNIEFKKDHLDLILTPWFIDIVPRSFFDLAAHLNQNLPKGGKWVNIGQLAFEKNDLAQKLTPDEIKEILEHNGFRLEEFKIIELPYLTSPYSTMNRVDQILVFSAIKEKSSKKPARFEYLPPWLRQLDEAIPLAPEILNLTTKTEIFAKALRYVDGKKSFEQIAGQFAQEFKMDLNSAREGLHFFFVNVYEQTIFREF